MRVRFAEHALTSQRRFPFLFGGAFIEAMMTAPRRFALNISLPFWEGLSLRLTGGHREGGAELAFPFLLGGTFIEAQDG